MAYFTQEEYDKMRCELLEQDFPCFDTMLHIANKTLTHYVEKECFMDPALRGGEHDWEIMQEVYIRLVKTCIPNFFLNEGNPNKDANNFRSWMFTVTSNIICDYTKKIKKIQFNESEEMPIDLSYHERNTMVITEKDLKRLKCAVATVLQSSSKPYIILTWFAQLIVISRLNVNRIESTDVIAKKFDSMTLDHMLNLLIAQSKQIEWLQLKTEMIEKLRGKMNEVQEDGIRMGDKKYHDFYMKKGSKSTISDWINRMNSLVKREEEKR